MAILQSLRQQHFLERSMAPTSSRMLSGMSGVSEGVPKFHSLKSSMPSVMKSTSLMHGLRIKKFSLKMPSLKIRMPHV